MRAVPEAVRDGGGGGGARARAARGRARAPLRHVRRRAGLARLARQARALRARRAAPAARARVPHLRQDVPRETHLIITYYYFLFVSLFSGSGSETKARL